MLRLSPATNGLRGAAYNSRRVRRPRPCPHHLASCCVTAQTAQTNGPAAHRAAKANRGRGLLQSVTTENMFKQFVSRANAVPLLMGRVRGVRGIMNLSQQTSMAPAMQSARMFFPSPEKICAGACQTRNVSQWCSRLIIPFNASDRGNFVASLGARGFASKKHKSVIRQSKGFRGRANRCFRIAIRRLEKSWQYAYRDRKVRSLIEVSWVCAR